MVGYGIGPWGAITWGATAGVPVVLAAVSLDGFRIEVFFSEDMRSNAAFFDPANYVVTSFFGAPVVALSIVVGTAGPAGPLSAIVTHTGTTLGGFYRIRVNNVEGDGGGPLIQRTTSPTFSRRGMPPHTRLPQRPAMSYF